MNIDKPNRRGPSLARNVTKGRQHGQKTDVIAEIRCKAYRVLIDLTISTDVEETARCIVGAGAESVSIGEELYGIDVGLVTGKGLHSLTGPDIPQFGESVTGARDENVVLVSWIDAYAHNVSKVVGELGNLRSSLDIPQHTGHVPRGCQDAAIVDEPAAREVSGVAGKLAGYTGWPFTRREIVNRADIVKTTASHVVTARSIGASHHPRGAEGNGMDFVRGVRIPDDELAVLRGGYQVSPISGPMHGIYLGQVAFEDTSRLHSNSREHVSVALCNSTHYIS